MIDLHLHTTASDGHSTPQALVDESAAAGLRVMAVTDHDTIAAVSEVRAVAAERGIHVVPGIEITAIDDGRDVHVLGYFLDPGSRPLSDFLVRQRQQRVARVEEIASKLTSLGLPIDIEPLREQARLAAGRSIGRPQVARALIAAGHVSDVREAFDKWLAIGNPAFVPRAGAAVEVVIGIIHEAGGVASLAHPGQTGIDTRIPALIEAGLDALEAYHPDHDPLMTGRYMQLARDLRLMVTGGSDYHGDSSHGSSPGAVCLPESEWARLQASRTS